MKVTFENQEGSYYSNIELSLEEGDDNLMISVTDTAEDPYSVQSGEYTSSSCLITKKTLSNIIGQLLHIQSKMKK